MNKFLSLLLLVSFLIASCGVQAPLPTPTSSPLLAAPTVLPGPRLLERRPAEGERLLLDAFIELVFDQAMDADSTASAFALTDSNGFSLAGTITWPDARTLRFQPAKRLTPSSTYIVTLAATATSAEGNALAEPIRFEVQTVESLLVAQVFPPPDATDVDLNTTITVIFNRPVVPTVIAEEQADLPHPLTIQPAVAGSGHWLNSSVYVFQPETLLVSGLSYLVSVDAGLTDTIGMELQESFVWKFTTRAPRLDYLSLKDGEVNPPMNLENVRPDQAFVISFLQPMDQASTNAAVRLIDRETGRTFPIKLTWDETSTKLTVSPVGRYRLSAFYQLELSAAARAQDGSPLAEGLLFRFSTLPRPYIVRVTPGPGAEQEYFDSWLSIKFSSPMDFDTLKNRVRISPPPKDIQYFYDSHDWTLNVIGLEPSTNYVARLMPGMADIYGNVIPHEYAWSFRTGKRYPTAYLVLPPTLIYRVGGDQSFFFEYTNLTSAEIALYAITPEQFLRLQYGAVSYENFTPSGEPIRTWNPDLSIPLNKQHVVEYTLEDAQGRPLPPGHYFIGLKAEPFDYRTNFLQGAAILIATDNITFKVTQTEGLAWLTDLHSGEPVKDVPILFYNEKGRQLGKAITDEKGLAYVADLPERPFFACTADGRHVAFANWMWGSGVSAGSFGIYEDYWTPVREAFGFLYTERPLYRPGQEVFIKGIIRQNDDLNYSLAEQSTVWVRIDFQGETVFDQQVALNDMGTFALAYRLSKESALGTYDVSVRFNRDDQQPFAWHAFRVAEYRKPEFRVNVAPKVKDVLVGEPYSFALDATYYAGGALAGAQVEWFLQAQPATFIPSADYADYSFADFDFDAYDYERYHAMAFLDEGVGKLNADGRFEISKEATLGKHLDGRTISFSVNVTDVAGSVVGGSASLRVHPSLVYVGLRSTSYLGIENVPVDLDLVVVDWASQPVPDQVVSVDIVRREWYSVQEKDAQGTLRWVTSYKDTPIETARRANIDRDGRARLSFTPRSAGIYRVVARVRDSKGNEHRASLSFWVAGKEYVPWRQTNDRSFQVVADKGSYSVGETARLFLAQPFPGDHYALVTYERGHIYRRDVIRVQGSTTVYELPITADMAPVAYVSVIVIKGADQASGPDFRVGLVRLNVNLEQHRLQVDIQADKPSAGPREKVTYTVTVKDHAGQPVEAELSLALVDEAVLALAPPNSPPMLEAFYPLRALAVVTSVGLVWDADKYNRLYRQAALIGDGMGSGGGKGEGDWGVITVRQDFRDTAFYQAQVRTDANGKARVTVTLPENLTTWRMTARAVTRDSRVGEAVHQLVSSKPLLVHVQAPRFFVADDTARVGATILNNTAESLEVTVVLEAQGVTVRPPLEQRVSVPAGRQQYLFWEVRVAPEAQRVDLTVRARGGAYQDAAKPAVGVLEGAGIPVYTFSVSEMVGTSGVLREQGSVTEIVRLPTSLEYRSPRLRVELSPSLAASLVDSLKALEAMDDFSIEQTISRLLSNLAAARALELAGRPSQELQQTLDQQVNLALQRINTQQHFDGGWGWLSVQESDPHTTAYVLLGLVEAKQAGHAVDQETFDRAVEYLRKALPRLSPNDAVWKFNRQAFILYALGRAGVFLSTPSEFLYEYRAHLGLYGKALLAQVFFLDDPQNKRIKTLMADLVAAAISSAAGTHWEEPEPDLWNWNSDGRTTAIVLDTLLHIQPDSPLTLGAVRWLMAHRRPQGWASSQETVWILLALTHWLSYAEELQSRYVYGVDWNGVSLAQDEVTAENLTTPIIIDVSSEQLSQAVNYLVIARGAGAGNLYYAAYLQAALPVSQVQALDRGLSISRQYFTLDNPKKPITQIRRGELVRVRVTIVAPSALHYVVINDPLPAGLEAVDASLRTDVQVPHTYSVVDFERRGWGWWYFKHIELYDERVVLAADYLPAGTYVFTYLARAAAVGTFHAIPTTAYQLYFPDVYGRSQGMTFTVQP